MNDELIAKTPIGEIVVGIKSDHDYPGIFVELRGEHLNDRFKEGSPPCLGGVFLGQAVPADHCLWRWQCR